MSYVGHWTHLLRVGATPPLSHNYHQENHKCSFAFSSSRQKFGVNTKHLIFAENNEHRIFDNISLKCLNFNELNTL